MNKLPRMQNFMKYHVTTEKKKNEKWKSSNPYAKYSFAEGKSKRIKK